MILGCLSVTGSVRLQFGGWPTLETRWKVLEREWDESSKANKDSFGLFILIVWENLLLCEWNPESLLPSVGLVLETLLWKTRGGGGSEENVCVFCWQSHEDARARRSWWMGTQVNGPALLSGVSHNAFTWKSLWARGHCQIFGLVANSNSVMCWNIQRLSVVLGWNAIKCCNEDLTISLKVDGWHSNTKKQEFRSPNE